MDKQTRLLIIGLDGATWTILKPWMDDGSLPNLARLRNHGSWGELRSTIPPLTAPAWSSFLTGKNPGKHGVFHFFPVGDALPGPRPKTRHVVDGRSINSPTLWDILGHHGRMVGVVNVPMSYPPRPVNGFMITGLLTPPGATVFTYPTELSRKLDGYQVDLDRFIGQKPFDRDELGAKRARKVRPDLQLVREFYDMEDKRARTVLALMDSEPWDLFMIVFTAPDRMGHYLWPYHRAEDLDGSPESKELHEAIYRFYVRLDEHVGEISSKAGESATIIVMSDHGMGPIYSKNAQWNSWLYKKGYLAIEKETARTPDAWLLRLGLARDKIRHLVDRVPGVSSSRFLLKLKSTRPAAIDFEGSKAYYVRIFDPVGGIRINGEAGARRALRNELMELIKGVIDPSTGKRIVRWVLPREDCYKGPYSETMPDIILVMHPEYGSSDRLSNYSDIVTERPSTNDPGGHRMEGIFVATGPEVASRPEGLTGLQIEDVAPTVLHLMGLPIPSDMDGRVLSEILTPSSRRTRTVVKCPPLGKWPADTDAGVVQEELSAEEAELIQDRLRALGYLK